MEKMLRVLYMGDGEYAVFLNGIVYDGSSLTYVVYVDEDDIQKPCSTETTKYILNELKECCGFDINSVEHIAYYTNTHSNLSSLDGRWMAFEQNARPVLIQDCDIYGNPLPSSRPIKHLQMREAFGGRKTYIPINDCNDMESIGNVLQNDEHVDPNMIINFAGVENRVADEYYYTQTKMVDNNLIVPASFVPRPNNNIPNNTPLFNSPNINVTNDGISGGFKLGPFNIKASFNW